MIQLGLSNLFNCFAEAQKINLNLQILNFLISVYESQSLEEAKEIFKSKPTEEDIKLRAN